MNRPRDTLSRVRLERQHVGSSTIEKDRFVGRPRGEATLCHRARYVRGKIWDTHARIVFGPLAPAAVLYANKRRLARAVYPAADRRTGSQRSVYESDRLCADLLLLYGTYTRPRRDPTYCYAHECHCDVLLRTYYFFIRRSGHFFFLRRWFFRYDFHEKKSTKKRPDLFSLN